MADVEALCKRVIVIHNGKLLFDGGLTELVGRFSAFKTIRVTLDHDTDLTQYGEVIDRDGVHATLRVPKATTAQVTGRILSEQQVDDLTVEDPPIDDVIEKVFTLQNSSPIFSDGGGREGEGEPG
jgi:ABC-2 type transport system ATP-binding protein